MTKLSVPWIKNRSERTIEKVKTRVKKCKRNPICRRKLTRLMKERL